MFYSIIWYLLSTDYVLAFILDAEDIAMYNIQKSFLFLQYVSFWWVRQHIINQLIKNKIIDISNKLEKYSTESF